MTQIRADEGNRNNDDEQTTGRPRHGEGRRSGRLGVDVDPPVGAGNRLAAAGRAAGSGSAGLRMPVERIVEVP
jgi:hypothetical protein